jgi:hypothetical protein
VRALAAASLLVAAAVPASEPVLSVVLRCEPAPAPGRVRCALALEVDESLRFTWVDALVVRAPAFARPLRSRVAQRKLSGKDSKAEVLLALLASGTGRGTFTVRARGVACSRVAPSVCRPLSREASIELEVGH